MKASRKVEQAILSRLRLDAETGKLYWKHYYSNFDGKEAGCIRVHHGRPRVFINIERKGMSRARIVYFLYYGKWPEPMVDHINHNTLDDRPINLRAADRDLNTHNHEKRNITVTKQGRYMARLGQKSVGTFDTREEAKRAYDLQRALQWGT